MGIKIDIQEVHSAVTNWQGQEAIVRFTPEEGLFVNDRMVHKLAGTVTAQVVAFSTLAEPDKAIDFEQVRVAGARDPGAVVRSIAAMNNRLRPAVGYSPFWDKRMDRVGNATILQHVGFRTSLDVDSALPGPQVPPLSREHVGVKPDMPSIPPEPKANIVKQVGVKILGADAGATYTFDTVTDQPLTRSSDQQRVTGTLDALKRAGFLDTTQSEGMIVYTRTEKPHNP